MSANSYSKYLALKEKLSIKKDGIDFLHPLSIDVAKVCFNKQTIGFKDIFRLFITRPKSENFDGLFSNEVLLVYEVKRDDYLELIKLVVLKIKGCVGFFFNEAREIKVDIFNITQALWFIIFRLRGEHLSIKNILYLASSLAYYMQFSKQLSKIIGSTAISLKECIVFNSSIGLEALFVQVLQNFGVKTYSLSHAISYVGYKNNVPIDIINGENITSNYVFVWGESSKKDLMENFNRPPNTIIVGGNLKYARKSLSVKSTFNFGLVMLGRSIYNDGNLEILEILHGLKKFLDIQFEIKLHPELDKLKYQELCNTYGFDLVAEDLTLNQSLNTQKYDFAIVNNSTAYYEAMYHDLICFRFGLGENEIYMGLNDKFFNSEGLLERINFFKSQDTESLNSQIEDLLIKVLGMGIDNYDNGLSANRNKI